MVLLQYLLGHPLSLCVLLCTHPHGNRLLLGEMPFRLIVDLEPSPRVIAVWIKIGQLMPDSKEGGGGERERKRQEDKVGGIEKLWLSPWRRDLMHRGLVATVTRNTLQDVQPWITALHRKMNSPSLVWCLLLVLSVKVSDFKGAYAVLILPFKTSIFSTSLNTIINYYSTNNTTVALLLNKLISLWRITLCLLFDLSVVSGIHN